MHRFFIKKENINKNRVKITGEDYNHIVNSLRLKTGDKIVVCCKNGIDYTTVLKQFDKKNKVVKGNIIEQKVNKSEPEVNIELAQAIPKDRKMELIAEKCTEIGVKVFIPLITSRTVVKLSNKKKNKRINRWQRIAEAAAKQSQRGIVPSVKDIKNIQELITCIDSYDLVLLLWTGEKSNSIHDLLTKIELNNISDILAIIGPEGGFTDKEVNSLSDNNKCFPVNLGSRILRTETAGLVVSSIILYEFQEFA